MAKSETARCYIARSELLLAVNGEPAYQDSGCHNGIVVHPDPRVYMLCLLEEAFSFIQVYHFAIMSSLQLQ